MIEARTCISEIVLSWNYLKRHFMTVFFGASLSTVPQGISVESWNDPSDADV